MIEQRQLVLNDLKQYLDQIPQILNRLAGVRALVVGDIGLDEYLKGEVRRVSPEAPVPILEVLEQDSRLGLTGNVAQNLASLGGQVELVTVCGQDETSQLLKEKLKNAAVTGVHMIDDPSRPTTRKVRAMAGPHHLLRFDFEKKQHLTKDIEDKVIAKCEQLMSSVDVVLVEDYAKGFLTPRLMSKLVEMAKQNNKLILVDPNPKSPSSLYKNVDSMTPNRDEAVALSGVDYDELRDHPNLLLTVGEKLKKDLNLKTLVMTRGKDGMSLFTDGQVTHLPTFAKQVFDVTGAGDTVIAALGLALAAGEDLVSACVLANLAAGVVVAKVGCVPCSKEELLAARERALEELN